MAVCDGYNSRVICPRMGLEGRRRRNIVAHTANDFSEERFVVGRLPAVGPSLIAAGLCFAATSILLGLAGCGGSNSSLPVQTAPAATAMISAL
jgi:hypothetical protein